MDLPEDIPSKSAAVARELVMVTVAGNLQCKLFGDDQHRPPPLVVARRLPESLLTRLIAEGRNKSLNDNWVRLSRLAPSSRRRNLMEE